MGNKLCLKFPNDGFGAKGADLLQLFEVLQQKWGLLMEPAGPCPSIHLSTYAYIHLSELHILQGPAPGTVPPLPEVEAEEEEEGPETPERPPSAEPEAPASAFVTDVEKKGRKGMKGMKRIGDTFIGVPQSLAGASVGTWLL
jgi:hypothetical protein